MKNNLEILNLNRREAFELIKSIIDTCDKEEYERLNQYAPYYFGYTVDELDDKVRNYELEEDLLIWYKRLVNLTEVCPFNWFDLTKYNLQEFSDKLDEYIAYGDDEYVNWIKTNS